ncbi:MAG: hypothetical protein ACQET8_21970 [Bacillota bacterium]|jgi:hypothetical protein
MGATVSLVKGAVSVDKKTLELLQEIRNNLDTVSIEDIKTILGVDKINPIIDLDTQQTADDNGDYFKEWYEDELRGRFEKFIEEALQRNQ